MPAKICPRCGNLYEDLKSKTCPNCFAVLEPIDRETAQAMARARAEVEQSPEWQAVKAADDERWREQSFRACLGVVGIFLATIVFAVILITVAAHRHSRSPRRPAATRAVAPASPSIGSAGPAANAALEEVMPARVGPFERTLREDVPLAGLTTPAFHGSYALHGDPLQTVDVFAFPTDRPAIEQNQFLSSVDFVARDRNQFQPPALVPVAHWRYVLLGPAASGFSAALAAQFAHK